MLIELLRSRRSIRKFSEKPVEKEKVALLTEAMLRSPSSRSRDPLSFVVVEKKESIEALSRSKAYGSSFMKNAPLAIVVCADPQRSDVWVEDASVAATLIHLTAHDLGLGSCWVQIRKRGREDGTTGRDYIAALLDLREGLEVQAVIAIGYPAEDKPGHDQEKLRYDRVSYETYGQRQ